MNRLEASEVTCKEVADAMYECAVENRAGGSYRIYTVDSAIGSGKTYAAKKAIIENDYSCLFFAETNVACDQIAEEIGGEAVHAGNSGNKTVISYFEEVRKKSKRLVLTHATLRNIVRKEKATADELFAGFDVVVIDELFRSFTSYVVDIQEMNKLLPSIAKMKGEGFLLEDCEKVEKWLLGLGMSKEKGIRMVADDGIRWDEMAEFIRDDVENSEDGYRFLPADVTPDVEGKELVELSVDELTDFLNKMDEDRDKEHRRINFMDNQEATAYKVCEMMANKEKNVLYVELRQSGVWLISAVNLLPATCSYLILSDGLKRDPLSIALEANRKLMVKPINLPRGDWSNYTFTFMFGNSGKTAYSDKEQDTYEYVKQVLDEPLIVASKHFKAGMCEEDAEDVITWGLHKGTNEYTDYRNVAILTLFRKRAPDSSAGFMANAEGDIVESQLYEELDVPLLSVYQDVCQAMGRMNRDATDDEVNVYCMLRNDRRTTALFLKWLKEDYPNINIQYEDWLQIMRADEKVKVNKWAGLVAGKATVPEGGKEAYKLVDKQYRDEWQKVRKTQWCKRWLLPLLGIRIDGAMAYRV